MKKEQKIKQSIIPEFSLGSSTHAIMQRPQQVWKSPVDGQQVQGLSKGFTLIEILVVVLIISVLAAIAVPAYQKAVRKARYARMLAIIKPLALAMDRYYLEHGTYATSFDQLDYGISRENLTHCNSSWYKYDAIQLGDLCINLPTGPARGVSVFTDWGDVRNANGYQYLMQKYGRATPGIYCVQSRDANKRDNFCKGNTVSSDAWGDFYPLQNE